MHILTYCPTQRGKRRCIRAGGGVAAGGGGGGAVRDEPPPPHHRRHHRQLHHQELAPAVLRQQAESGVVPTLNKDYPLLCYLWTISCTDTDTFIYSFILSYIVVNFRNISDIQFSLIAMWLINIF